MVGNVTRLVLRVEDEHADPEELARLTEALRQELLDLNVDAVHHASAGEAPPDSRAFEIAALGTLVVSLAQSELLAAVVNAVAAWLANRRNQTIIMEVDGDVLELAGLPSKERQRLTEEWLLRRTRLGGVSASTRSALIIASRDYQDPGLRQLRSPAYDAAALARVLGDPKIGDFDVQTLLDAPSYEISEAVEEFFSDRSPDDLLLMHFSCHGVKDEGGELHFATSNTKLHRLSATSVAADFVNRRMNRSRSRRVVLLLDCCYAGAFERGMTARAGTNVNIEEQFGGGRGHAVITASNSMEYAFEGDQLADAHELAPSVFTSAFVEGLETGEADRDQDGQVSLDELYDYVYDKVRVTTPNQTPGKWTFGVQGDIYVARRARPVTTPAPLPSELQEALDHPIASVRLGVVQELARLTQSRHAGLALAARLALQRLTDDDSRSVSAAAAEALASGAIASGTLASGVLASGALASGDRAAGPTWEASQPEPQVRIPRQAGPPAIETLRGEAVPAAQASPVPQRPAGAPTPPADSAATAAAESAPPTEVASTPEPAPASGPDRRLLVASASAVLGAVLLIVSLFLPIYEEEYSDTYLKYAAISSYVIIVALVVMVAGVLAYLPRTRGLTATGVLAGGVAVSTSGLVWTIVFMLGKSSLTVFGAGEWLHLAGYVGLVVAGVLALRSLRRNTGVPVAFRWKHGPTPYLLLVLGLVNAVVLFSLWLNAYKDLEAERLWLLWTAAVALLVSTYAAGAFPRRFGSALLGGWAAAGVGLYVSLFYEPTLPYADNSVGIHLFGASLVALLITAVVHSRVRQ
jgi:Caspase domain